MDDAVPDDLDQLFEVSKDVENRARRVQDRAARAKAGGAPEAKSDRAVVVSSTAACERGGTGRRAGFRSRWGNPWGFESPRSHTLTFTKCQVKGRSGSVPSKDVRFHGAVTEQGARIPPYPRASGGERSY